MYPILGDKKRGETNKNNCTFQYGPLFGLFDGGMEGVDGVCGTVGCWDGICGAGGGGLPLTGNTKGIGDLPPGLNGFGSINLPFIFTVVFFLLCRLRHSLYCRKLIYSFLSSLWL